MLKPILLIGALFATGPALAAKVSLPGEVTYRERMALPEGAILRIELVDLALPDRPRVRVSAPTGAGQVPLAFTLTFDDSLILPQHSYALNAEIAAGDIRFRNTEPYGVNPLAPEAPIVIVTQRVAQVEPASVEPAPAAGELPLLDITWQAKQIGETPVPPGVEVTMHIEPNLRAGGVGGCNSWFSQTTITAESFAAGVTGRTQRSCGYDRNMLEQSFFEALAASAAWRLDNDTLTLLDASGKPTLIFER